jgi:23S rRNA (uracil-5-)-methyltransferase RumA
MLANRGYKAYREDFKRGQLRHMILRRTPFSSQVLLTLVTGVENVEGMDRFAADVMKQFPDIKGVILNCNDRDSSAVLGFRDTLLRGRNEIWDKLCDLNVCINSRTFYQINAPQAQKLYDLAVSKAELTKNDTVLDAYCGVGVIGMLAAGKAGRVTGIEIVKDSVQCAERAKQRNQISNITFIQGDVMKALRKQDEHYNCVFLDPPRAGLAADFTEALVQHAPEKIIYISCFPETLKRDTERILAAGYRLEFIRGVDMFPFTEHCEAVCKLVRK